MDIHTPNARVLRFGAFELDRHSGELRRHGQKIRLPEQSFQILKALLSRPGDVVTRDELRHVLWTPETFVDFDVGLNSAVRKLREALDDSAENPRFVETLPRRGYRFVASVTAAIPASPLPLEPGVGQGSVLVCEPVLTSAARSRTPGWRAVGLLLVILVAATAFVHQRGGLAALREEPATEPIRSLVVLPFENLTGGTAHEYFADAVTDAVTGHLAQVDGLEVISRTSARQYKATAKRVPEIGSELRVDAVVQGAVVKGGAGVRITAQLIRAATDRHMWAQAYEGRLSHMIALQERIASDLAAATGRPLLPPAGTRIKQRIDPQAYDAYLKGLTTSARAMPITLAQVRRFMGRSPNRYFAHFPR